MTANTIPFDGLPTALADQRPERRTKLARLRAEGGVADALGEGGGVGDVGEEYDGGAGGNAVEPVLRDLI